MRRRVLISGSSSNHAVQLVSFCYYASLLREHCLLKAASTSNASSSSKFGASNATLHAHSADCFAVHVWDLGLAAHEHSALRQQFGPKSVRLRTFDFSAFPKWMSLAVSKDMTPEMIGNPALPRPMGEYAWKVAILSREFRDASSVLWLDSSCRMAYPSLLRAFAVAEQGNGFLGFHGGGLMREWVRPELFDRFHAWQHQNERMCLGGAVAFAHNTSLGPSLLADWASCSLELECIAPGNASRADSRQDQSVLTALANTRGIRACKPPNLPKAAASVELWAWVGEHGHADIDCPCTEALCRGLHEHRTWPGGQAVYHHESKQGTKCAPARPGASTSSSLWTGSHRLTADTSRRQGTGRLVHAG